MRLHRPWRGEPGDETVVELTPEDAGWSWTGISVLSLSRGVPRTVRTGTSEAFVLPLSGGTISVDVVAEGGERLGSFTLTGRSSVFDAVTDFAYVGRDSVVHLTSTEGA